MKKCCKVVSFDLSVSLCSSPDLWSWTLGSDQRNSVQAFGDSFWRFTGHYQISLTALQACGRASEQPLTTKVVSFHSDVAASQLNFFFSCFKHSNCAPPARNTSMTMTKNLMTSKQPFSLELWWHKGLSSADSSIKQPSFRCALAPFIVCY